MKRPTLSGYENEVAQPSVEVLLAFSDYFKIAIDSLIKVDLSALPESQLRQIEVGYDVYIKGSNLRILSTTVDSGNNENIELVSEKAKAGYTTGYADPEYIKILPAFKLPFLSKERKYRTFQISGDSMLPIPDKSWVTGEYVENWQSIRDKQPYIILTLDDGIVFKIVENKIENEGKIVLHSLNSIFEPYAIDIKDVKEVWKFIHYISSEMPEANMEKYELVGEIKALRKEEKSIQMKLNL
jgi:transcriptional regulator with XRE-family HTH domain